jgi:prophage DNA circulation protein
MAGALLPGLAGLLGLDQFGAPVSLDQRVTGWRKRLRPASFKSPSGIAIRFQYVDLSMEFELRGTPWEFPQVNDAYIQKKGFGPRKYPLLCYFSGDNCDLEAKAFVAAICEPGQGFLHHPLYGDLNNVVPFGTVKRTDAVTTAGNQTIVEVTFWTTTGAVYPNSDPATQNEIAIGLGDFDLQAAQAFNVHMRFNKAALRVGAIATIKGGLKKFSSAMSAVSNSTTAIRREVQDGLDALNFGMDVLIGQPLLLAQQISNLIKTPGRAIAGIGSRLDGYGRMIDDIVGSPAANPAEQFGSGTSLLQRRDSVANDFHSSDLFVMNAVAGSILAAALRPASGAPATFTTRTQAIAAADIIAQQFDAMVAFRDAGFAAFGAITDVSETRVDTGESIQALQAVASLAVGFLVQTSFGLKPEQTVVTDRARTILDLSAELYDNVDEKLDLIIDSNNLSGDEILELQAGRPIVYFPEA